MSYFSLSQFGQRHGGAASGGNPRKHVVDDSDDVAILAPIATASGTEWGLAQFDHAAAFSGNLSEFCVREEGNPPPVRREERSLCIFRPRQLGGTSPTFAVRR